jgi:hypothetical protein
MLIDAIDYYKNFFFSIIYWFIHFLLNIYYLLHQLNNKENLKIKRERERLLIVFSNVIVFIVQLLKRLNNDSIHLEMIEYKN